MELTAKNKAHIDSFYYEHLLSRWRFAPIGDPWFQGETGKYWGKRLKALRDKMTTEEHVAISKKLG